MLDSSGQTQHVQKLAFYKRRTHWHKQLANHGCTMSRHSNRFTWQRRQGMYP